MEEKYCLKTATGEKRYGTAEDFNLEPDKYQGKKIRHECPECNKSVKSNASFEFDYTNGIGHCFSCDCTVNLIDQKPQKSKNRMEKTDPNPYGLPDPVSKKSGIGDTISNYEFNPIIGGEELEFFLQRGISEPTVRAFDVGVKNYGTEQRPRKRLVFASRNHKNERERIWERYNKNGEKCFSEIDGGHKGLFKPNNCLPSETVVICEGQTDTMAAYEAIGNEPDTIIVGMAGANSVSYIENDIHLIDNPKTKNIVIALDSDKPGREGTNKVIGLINSLDRYDIDIYVVDPGQYNDINNYLINTNRDHLRNLLLNQRTHVNTERSVGIGSLEVSQAMRDILSDEGSKGSTTYYAKIDEIWKWRPATVTILTGYANEGKSTLMSQLIATKALMEPGWGCAVFAPEHKSPAAYTSELLVRALGRNKEFGHPDRIDPDLGLKFAIEKFGERIRVIEHRRREKGTAEFKKVLKEARRAIIKYDLKALVLDPYNMIDHDKGSMSDADYTSWFSNELTEFAQDLNISVILVAHQVTPQTSHRTDKDGESKKNNLPPPNMYNIRGGGNFADKADMVLTYWRPYNQTDALHRKVVLSAERIRDRESCGLRTGAIELGWHPDKYRLVCIDQNMKTSNDVWYQGSDQDSIKNGTAPLSLPEAAVINDVLDDITADFYGIERVKSGYQFIKNNQFMRAVVAGDSKKVAAMRMCIAPPAKTEIPKPVEFKIPVIQNELEPEEDDCPF